ncbi:acyl carrier protein [Candidatus Karelsulcia muelleri]|uniref:acyl carrier protein n=1 Tax=Candidatus Karelsulcia muelleri TaxID=336810 RepID=UPI002167FCE7|nr:acyl carrier protein [Candidatus Karelsulcia muelleri]
MNEIFLKIKSIIIEKLGVDEKKVIPEASFINDLGADSLDSIELIMEFEKEFQIIISDDEKFMTVDDVNKYIKKYLDYKK